MTTYKRGGRWYYDFMIRRQRHRSAIPEARTKAQADRAESDAREAIYQRRFGGAGDAITLKCFFESYYLPWAETHKRSHRQDKLRGKALLTHFGKWKLAEIHSLEIEKFKAARASTPARIGGSKTQTRPRAPQSVNHDLALLSRVLSRAVASGLIPKNPCEAVDKLPVDNRRTRVCSAEEEAQLRAWLPAALQPMFAVALQTGTRAGELVNLDWADVDFGRRTIYVRRSKNGRPRSIPMSTEAQAVLEQLAAERNPKQSAVFVNRFGCRYRNPGAGLRATCKRLGIVDLHWHDLRHTVATRLAAAGVDIYTMAEILGHEDINMTKRYTHADTAAKRQAVEALAQKSCPKIVAISDWRAAG